MKELNTLDDIRAFLEDRQKIHAGIIRRIEEAHQQIRRLTSGKARASDPEELAKTDQDLMQIDKDLQLLELHRQEAELDTLETAVIDSVLTAEIMEKSDDLRAQLPGVKAEDMEELSIPLWKTLAAAEEITANMITLAPAYDQRRTVMIRMTGWQLVKWCQDPSVYPVYEELIMLASSTTKKPARQPAPDPEALRYLRNPHQ